MIGGDEFEINLFHFIACQIFRIIAKQSGDFGCGFYQFVDDIDGDAFFFKIAFDFKIGI